MYDDSGKRMLSRISQSVVATLLLVGCTSDRNPDFAENRMIGHAINRADITELSRLVRIPTDKKPSDVQDDLCYARKSYDRMGGICLLMADCLSDFGYKRVSEKPRNVEQSGVVYSAGIFTSSELSPEKVGIDNKDCFSIAKQVDPWNRSCGLWSEWSRCMEQRGYKELTVGEMRPFDRSSYLNKLVHVFEPRLPSSGKTLQAPVLEGLEKAKMQCKELGFKPGTEKFGECVLKITK